MVCQEWVVADVNHDGTEDTVDLVMKYLYSTTGNNCKMSYGYSSDGHSGCTYYSAQRCSIRYQEKFIFAKDCMDEDIFRSIIPMKTYIVTSTNTPANVALLRSRSLSLRELGWDYTYLDNKSSYYPLFGNGNNNNSANTLVAKQYPANASGNACYWTRDSYTYYEDSKLWNTARYIDENGRWYSVNADSYYAAGDNANYGIVNAIRFGKIGNNSKLNDALSKANPIDALTSGKIDDSYIGKMIKMPINGYDTISNLAIICEDWIIIGTNCDNTSGTVDLISYSPIIRVSGDGVRESMQHVYDNIPSNIKTKMLDIGYTWDNTQYTDKIKVPTIGELFSNYTNSGCSSTKYKYFSDINTNCGLTLLDTFFFYTSNGINYKGRVNIITRYSGAGGYINTNGEVTGSITVAPYYFGCHCIIRFGKK